MNFKLINDIEIEAAQFMDDTESIMQIVDMFPKTDITVSYFDPHKPKLKQDGRFELNGLLSINYLGVNIITSKYLLMINLKNILR